MDAGQCEWKLTGPLVRHKRMGWVHTGVMNDIMGEILLMESSLT